MSRSLNRVQLIGHLGRDIEVKFTPSGTQVGQFSLATSRRWKDKQSGEWKEETDWHRCVLWNCDKVASFLTKGKQVFLEGRLQTRDYTDREGVKRYTTEVVVEDLILLGVRDSNAPLHPAASAPPPDDPHGVSDDDVPF